MDDASMCHGYGRDNCLRQTGTRCDECASAATVEYPRVSFIGKCRACKKHSQFTAEIADKTAARYHEVTGRMFVGPKRSWRVLTGRNADTVTRLEGPWNGKWTIGLPCHKCGKTMTFTAVAGEVTEKPCGARCMASTGPSCECACGGKNHGASHC